MLMLVGRGGLNEALADITLGTDTGDGVGFLLL